MKRLYENYLCAKRLTQTIFPLPQQERIMTGPFYDPVWVSTSIRLKLAWFVASVILGSDFSFDESCMPTAEKGPCLKNNANLGYIADNIYSLCHGFMDPDDVYYRQDYVSNEISGKHWNFSSWESLSDYGYFMENGGSYEFHSFFKDLKDEKVTSKNFKKWYDCFLCLMEYFLPSGISGDMADLLLEENRDIFFSKPCDHETYNQDFEMDALEEITRRISSCRSEDDGKMGKIIVAGFRERFSISQEEMTDHEVFQCFKALHTAPLSVEFLKTENSRSPMEYAILKSKSLGYLLSHRKNPAWLDSLPQKLVTELNRFYGLIPKTEIVFPYLHNSYEAPRVNVFYTEHTYICGMYVSLTTEYECSNYNVESCGTLLAPSFTDMAILRYADGLYDAIKKIYKEIEENEIE